MRIAVFSDVHGNTVALDAVLAAIAHESGPQPLDGYWIVGDLVALGPGPANAARTLASLPNARFVRGNTDRYVLAGNAPWLPDRIASVQGDGEALEGVLALNASFPWAAGAIATSGHDAWLRAIPLEVRVTLPDGTRVLLVHAAPGTDDGRGIDPEMTDAELAEALASADADLVIVGHTHVPLDRTVEVDGLTVRVHNLGSVSLPGTDEHRAMWTLLTADETGYALERRFAAYDIARMKAMFDTVHHPAADALKARFP
ncbi:MAG: metallophosphoesterase family protein [Thermomicrobiales bacterium]